MNETKLFFFLGQSGAGKGTQVAMVLELLKTMNRDVLYVAMGDEVRGTVKNLPDDNFLKII